MSHTLNEDDLSIKVDVLRTIIEHTDDDDDINSYSISSTSDSADASVPSNEYSHSDDDSFEQDDDENYHQQELDRIEFFLQCLDLVTSSPTSSSRNHSADVERNQVDQDSDDEAELQEDDPTSQEVTTRSASSNSHPVLSSATTALSQLDDPEVLKALRLSLRCPGGLAEGLDPAVAVYIKLFEFAQTRRHREYRVRPYGILGLFNNLSDIRSDLMWAQDAVHRRETNKPYVAWADYYRKEVGGLVFPYFSVLLIATSITMLILAFHRNDWVIESFDINPLLGPSPEVLLELGALQGKTLVENREWWRLITPIVLHAGIIHLLLNIACIALLGRTIERNHGFFRTSILFIVSAVGGNMISALMQPSFVLVGASGGIFGLMGMCVADIILNWRLLFLIFEQRPAVLAGRFASMDKEEEDGDEEERDKTRSCFGGPSNYNFGMRIACGFWLLFDIMLNSLFGFTPFVDNFAHLGGLVYGFLLSLSSLKLIHLGLDDQDKESGKVNGCGQKVRTFTLRSFGTACTVILLLTSFGMIGQSNGMNSPCFSCRFMSCIPFPFWVSEEKRWWSCDVCNSVNADIHSYDQNGADLFSDIDLHCPRGYTKTVDISKQKYDSFSAVEDDLEALCRKECE